MRTRSAPSMRREIPADIVYEDDRCVAFRDIHPQAPTHILVVPREAIETLDHTSPSHAALLGHLPLVATELARREGLAQGGYRRVTAQFSSFRADLDHTDEAIELDRERLTAALAAFFRGRNLSTDWDAVKQTADRNLVTSLSMMLPFGPAEKQALVEAAGVRVTQYGGMGAFSTMSLRGAPPGHVTVLLDGVPLTSAASGVVDLADVPSSAIESIELYRGAAPVAFASPTPGGLVNLVTRAEGDVRSVRVAGGSWGTGEVAGTLGARWRAWSLLTHGGWQGSDGDFRYHDDNGTPLDPSDDTIERRANARFDAATALARVSFSPNGPVQASLHGEWFRRGQGVPGAGSVPARNARYAADRATLAGELRAGPRDGSSSWTLRANTAARRASLRDTLGELGYGRVDTDERFRDRAVSLEWRAPAPWAGLAPAFGAALRAERVDPAAPTLGLIDPPTSRRDTRSAWLSIDQRVAGERLLLHAARRWDEQQEQVSDTRSTGVVRTRSAARTLNAPQLGARLALTEALAFRANWTRSGRAPDLDELFGIDGSVTGNPDLRPESSESWDAGFSWTARAAGVRWTAEWSTHATHANDLILFERSSPRGARPVNVSAARLRGEEASLRAAWRAFELSASTAWLSAIDRSTIAFYRGRRLPQRAEFQ